MAPVVLQCCERKDEVDAIVCTSGQHQEMLDDVTDFFQLDVDHRLDVMQPNQSLSALTGRCLNGLDQAIEETQPDCLVAQGDTTTVMVASMVAFYRRLPFVHVEAGLRTGNLLAPWPEEFNRRVAGLTASVHCAPTKQAAECLLREGVAPDTVHVTGNTVIDALLWTADRAASEPSTSMADIGDGPMVLITGHRRENFGDGFLAICTAIQHLSDQFPQVQFVYPVHLNPNVRRPVHELLAGRNNVHLLGPARYPDFVWLMQRSHLILTDSGGVQEEAPSLRKPVLVMRDTTERSEAVDAGGVALVGTDAQRIVAEVGQLLTDEQAYARMQIDDNPYGDGHAAERIVDLIARRAWQASQLH